ncbi:MAG TPA: ABC transporter permease [Opitutaceae bacterium]|jgi:phospholipid/cholesterol/gamma-HCH transport system permease protein
MSAIPDADEARVSVRAEAGSVLVELAGAWRLEGRTPRWDGFAGEPRPSSVRLTAGGVTQWDTSLVAYVGETRRWCASAGAPCDVSGLPDRVAVLSGQFEESLRTAGHEAHSHSFVTEVGLQTQGFLREVTHFLQFVGEFTMDSIRLVLGRAGLRWGDCVFEMQKCGAMALPIVSLISFLVGVTLAYSGAIVLRRFGGDIWVADLIGVAMTREMGALMAAIVLSGRTGAAYAAEIGSMKSNEELDALSTLGISPIRFLVIPRVLALTLMMPLLSAYATCLGILGGMAVAFSVLEIPPAAYWVEMLTIVDMPDFVVGVTKAVVFGVIVGVTGCLRGLQSERNASGVGESATSAVVTSLLLIIVADAIFAVFFNAVGL